MGDTTNGQLEILAIPEDQREAALEVIQAAGLGTDWFGGDSTYPTSVAPGDAFVDGNADGDLPSSIADDLIAAAPDAVWVAWTDPKYEWLGEFVAYAPGLGKFVANSDAQGDPVYGYAEVRDAADKLLTGELSPAEFDRGIGGPWLRRASELRS